MGRESAPEGGAAMSTEKKVQQTQQKPRETREAEPERKPSTGVQESREGLPGYGQPDEEVRDKQLPEQKW